MPRHKGMSKERQQLEERTRQALKGLGITNETAVRGVLSETLGVQSAPPSESNQTAQSRSREPIGASHSTPPSPQPSHPDLTPQITSPVTEPATRAESEETVASPGERVHYLDLNSLEPSPDQPRLQAEADPELLENIRVFGVRTPIHVRPIGPNRYQIVAGERRWRACQLLGMKTIPALIRQDGTELAAAEALIDNLLRKDLTGFEEAKGYKRLIDEHHFLKSELAQRLGCDKTRITRALQVLELPDHILELTLGPGSPLTLTHVQELLPLRSNAIRLQKLARQAVDGAWTARRIREEVTRVPRTNQGGQSVRFEARGIDGPFRLVIRFHPNRAHDIGLIEEGLRKADEHLQRFRHGHSQS